MIAGRNIEAVYRLSPLQEGILFHVLDSEDPSLYVGQYSCFLEGEPAPTRLRDSFRGLTTRHAALRTLFVWKRRELPVQIVRQRVELPWHYEDWRSLSSSDQERKLEARLCRDRTTGFDLERAPLLRASLLRLADRRFHLCLSYHHIILDGWSLRILLDEVAAGYSRPGANETVESNPPAYSHFIEWVHARDWRAADRFWLDMLSSFDMPTRLPRTAEGLSGAQSGRARVEHRFPACDVTCLEDFTREHHLTLNTLLVGAWATLLGRCTDHTDVVFGTTWAGRPHDLDRAQETVGLFINTLPVRVNILPESVVDWLTSIQRTLTAMRDHEQTPLTRVQRTSGVAAGEPLFESLVVLQSVPSSPQSDVPWRVMDEDYRESSNFPLVLLVRPGDVFRVSLVYDPGCFSSTFVERLMGQLLVVLNAFVAEPGRRACDVEVLSDNERRRLLELARGPQVAFDGPATVHGLIAQAARERPNVLALLEEGASVDYAGLTDRARRLAVEVRRVGGGKCRGVVFLERSIDAMTGMLAVLEAGSTYVPLDPGYPARRIRQVLEDLVAATGHASSGVVIITSRELAERLPNLGIQTLFVDDIVGGARAPSQALSTLASRTDAGAADIAYVMYTSGSTGRPKGVQVTHGNIVNSTLARGHYYSESPGRFLLLSSLATDSSIAGIFWTLCTGGTLILPPPRIEQSTRELTNLIARQRITHMLCLPSIHELMLEQGDAVSLQSLRCVIVAGEACPIGLVARHRSLLPQARLFNEYGPSEATVWATVAELGNGVTGGDVAIGRPIANTLTLILDRERRLVPEGLPGELFIGGAGVSRGYLLDEELTRERFSSDPFNAEDNGLLYRTGDRVRLLADGQLQFLGRVDNQIKVRGHRVEPEEIEHALLQVPGVTEAAVMLIAPELAKGGSGSSPAQQESTPRQRLTALVSTTNADVSVAWLREQLKALLPGFMIPHAFVFTDALPRAPSGKLDLPRLRAAAKQPLPTYEGVAPRNRSERQLWEIWCEVLGTQGIGIYDNFFELGGDSLMSIRILARAHRAGMDIKATDFFDRPTIAEQAGLVLSESEATPAPRGEDAVPVVDPDAVPLRKAAMVDLDRDSLAAIAKQLGKVDSDNP